MYTPSIYYVPAMYSRRQNKVYVLLLQYDCNTTTVCLKTTLDLRLVNCSIITVLIRYAQQRHYSTNTVCMQLYALPASTLCTEGSIFQAYYILLLHINKPHLVQAGRNARVENPVHTSKNGGYRYFKRLCPAVIGK